MRRRLARLGLVLLRTGGYLLLLLVVLALWNNDAPPFIYVAF
jgi:hypothetical protein